MKFKIEVDVELNRRASITENIFMTLLRIAHQIAKISEMDEMEAGDIQQIVSGVIVGSWKLTMEST